MFDYSQGRPSADEVRAAGGVACMRYLWFDGSNRKDLTTSELSNLLDGGIGVGFIWETTASRALGGYNAGVFDGGRAHAAVEALGVSDEPAIWFAVDFDVHSPTQFLAVLDYFRGILTRIPLYRVKAYGEYDVCQALMREGLASGYWQTTAWSGGKWSTDHHMIQRVALTKVGGTDADVNHWNSERFPDFPGIYFKEDRMQAKDVWDEVFTTPEGTQFTARDFLVWSNHYDNKIPILMTMCEGLAAGLAAVAAAVAANHGADAVAVKAAVLDAMEEGTVRVTVAIEQRQEAFLAQVASARAELPAGSEEKS